MLVLHCSLYIPVSHGSHDSSQVSGSLENSRPVVVPAAIENKILGKPSFSPGFPEPVRHRRKVSALCSLRASDAQIFTNDHEKLPTALGHDVSKQTAHALHTNVEQTIAPHQKISGPQQDQGMGLGISI